MSQRGFSLLELMVGLTILGFAVSMAIPSYMQWTQNTYIRNATEGVLNGLQQARSLALQRNTRVQFVVAADSAWTIRLEPPAATVLESRLAGEGVRNVTVRPTLTDGSASAPAIVTFDGIGRRIGANEDGSLPISEVGVDSTVLAAADSRDLRVTIGAGGQIRMCDSNAIAGDPRAC